MQRRSRGWGIADWEANNPLGMQAAFRRHEREENTAWRKREGKKTGSPWDTWDSSVKEHLRDISMEPLAKQKTSLQKEADWLDEQVVLGNMTAKEYSKLKAKYHFPGPSKKTWRYTRATGYGAFKR